MTSRNPWSRLYLSLPFLPLWVAIMMLPTSCRGTPINGSSTDNSSSNNLNSNHSERSNGLSSSSTGITYGSNGSSTYNNSNDSNGSSTYNNNNANASNNTHDVSNRISKLTTLAQQVKVLVVGGGVSGLSTVETLINNGVDDVLLLEATCRLGGRIKTLRKDGVLVEEGAEWIHGDKRNPIYRIANNLSSVGINVPEDDWEWLLVTENGTVHDEQNLSSYVDQQSSESDSDNEETSNWDLLMELDGETEANGVLIPYYHTGYGQYFIDRFPEVFGEVSNTTEGKALIHALEQKVNGEEGTNSWLDMSARDADAYVSYGEDHQWAAGYDTLITHILEKIPSSKVHLSSPVSEIYWDQDSLDRVLVVTSSGRSFLANHVVFTTSVEYLKENHKNVFYPSLPKSYINSLNGMALGVADKIQIGWDTPWWSDTGKSFAANILWTNMDLPKEMAWLYGVVEVFTVFQESKVLQMFVTGDNAKAMEALTEHQVQSHVIYLLKNITKKNVPRPTFFNRSQWGSNPWTLGSYSSYITMAGDKTGLHNREPLAKPLYNSQGKMVLSWAGEHTHNTRYGTVDGALESGIREAKRILKIINA